MKSEQINSYLEVKQRTERDVRQLGVLVSESYEADSTDGQTVINLNFTVDVNNKKQIWLFVDGMKLVEGVTANYTFTNIVGSLSSQITLNSPLSANLPIQAYKIGAYQETLPNPSSVTATLLNDVAQPHKMAQDAFQPFVKKEFITAPNTTIVNRAKVESASLKAIAGVERVMTRSLNLIRDEFGANGEPVYEVSSKETRLRLVGSGWSSISNTDGTRISSSTVGDFSEITFYGTGLNILAWVGTSPSTVLASVDGGAEGANIFPTASAVLAGRSYGVNQVLNIVSGLALGWHTVKLRHTVAGSGLNIYGFEILNERINLAVLSGTAYYAMKQEVLSALNASSFKAGVVGTRGARVVKYLKDGIISQAVTEVNGASAFFTSADHTNEEVYRKINFREFGANRADDFSTMTGTASSRAFTLDDGSTTLVCQNYLLNNGPSAVDGIVSQGNTAIIITFTGTGLDIIRTDNQNGTNQNNAVVIDGVSVGNLNTLSAVLQRREKICSGLPYGTHTVKITSAATYSFGVSDFIIYQPKKPTLPSGAIELTDYCVMADHVALSASGIDPISTGVLRKQIGVRESILVDGSGGTVSWNLALDVGNSVNGLQNYTNRQGGYFQCSGFLSGFEYRYRSRSDAATAITFTLNGLTLNTTNFPGLTASIVGFGTFNTTTGVLNPNNATSASCSLIIKGINLGHYTIRATITTASTQVTYCEAIDIITPIHFNNTKVGSLSLKDSRAFSPVIDRPEKLDMTKMKAFFAYNMVTGKIIDSMNISSVVNISTGVYQLYFDKPFKNKDYLVFGSPGDTGRYTSHFDNPISKQPGFCRIYNQTLAGGTSADMSFFVAFYGELEDEQEF